MKYEIDWCVFPDDLVKQSFSGNRYAEEEFFRKVLALVYFYAKSIGSKPNIRITRPEDIDDVVQNTLLSIIAKGPEFLLTVRDWHRFLYTVTYRRCIEFLRRRMRHDCTISLDETLAGDADTCTLAIFIGLPPDQEKAVERRERQERFEVFLETLPKDSREIVRLYVDGYSYKEIEKATGIEVNKATLIIYRANLALYEWLKKQNKIQEHTV